MPDHAPYRNFNFRVEIDGLPETGFSKVKRLCAPSSGAGSQRHEKLSPMPSQRSRERPRGSDIRLTRVGNASRHRGMCRGGCVLKWNAARLLGLAEERPAGGRGSFPLRPPSRHRPPEAARAERRA